VILPTHRVVHSLPGFDPVVFAIAAQQFFTVEPLDIADAASYMELLAARKVQPLSPLPRQGLCCCARSRKPSSPHWPTCQTPTPT